MFRTIFWYFYFGVSALFKTPQLLKAKQLEKKGLLEEKRLYTHKVTSRWALSQVRNSGATINVVGTENIPKDVPVVFISNHQGNFDIALFMAYIDKPKGFIAKVEMEKVPIISHWMKQINCVFMDRGNLRSAPTAILEGIKLIKEGNSLVIFPEGTRSKGDSLGDFKAGSFKLATKPKVPIIPVTIDGSYRLMEQNGKRIKPASVTMTIHPPINTATLTKEELVELPERVKAIIKTKLPN